MESLRELYRIGRGPSSSHTIAPTRAAELFRKENPDAESYQVTLYGSLSKTGKGHMTDIAILDVLGHAKCQVIFSDKPEDELPHPNTMVFQALDKEKNLVSGVVLFAAGR